MSDFFDYCGMHHPCQIVCLHCCDHLLWLRIRHVRLTGALAIGDLLWVTVLIDALRKLQLWPSGATNRSSSIPNPSSEVLFDVHQFYEGHEGGSGSFKVPFQRESLGQKWQVSWAIREWGDWARGEGNSGSDPVSKDGVFSGQKKIWNGQDGKRLKGRCGSGVVSQLCGLH